MPARHADVHGASASTTFPDSYILASVRLLDPDSLESLMLCEMPVTKIVNCNHGTVGLSGTLTAGRSYELTALALSHADIESYELQPPAGRWAEIGVGFDLHLTPVPLPMSFWLSATAFGSLAAMLLGRLEIFTLFVLISPAFWRR